MAELTDMEKRTLDAFDESAARREKVRKAVRVAVRSRLAYDTDSLVRNLTPYYKKDEVFGALSDMIAEGEVSVCVDEETMFEYLRLNEGRAAI